MANSIFGFPNYADSDFNTIVISGGSWVSGDGSILNLLDERLDKSAISDGVTLADTQFEIDLGSLRDIRMTAVPSHNMTLEAQWRVRGTIFQAWTGIEVGANASSGASSFTARNTTGSDIIISEGHAFTIGGYVYQCAADVTISASSTGTVLLESTPSNDSINATLQANIADNDSIECNSGDYSSTVYDSAWNDAFPVVYPFGSKPWGNPSAWTGKITEEERTKNKHPLIDTFITKIARFWKYEFDNTNSSQSGLRFSRLFVAPGYQVSLNPIYGADFGFSNETTVERSVDGVETFDRKLPFRVLGFTVSTIDQDEALANALELQRDAGSDKQIFFIFNPDDTLHMSRRAFTARMSRVDPLIYSNYSRMDFAGELREIQGGLLT